MFKMSIYGYIFGRWFLFVVHFHVIGHIIPSFCSIHALSYTKLNIPILKYEEGTKTAQSLKYHNTRPIHVHSTSHQILECKQPFALFPYRIRIQPFSGMTDLNMHLSWALMPSYFSHLQNIANFFLSLSACRTYVNKQLPTLIVHFWLNFFSSNYFSAVFSKKSWKTVNISHLLCDE